MAVIRITNREKAGRIFALVPTIFSQDYFKKNVVLCGGTALNLEFYNRRFPTDIDLRDLNPANPGFRKRFDCLADGLRNAAERQEYVFKINVSKSPKGKLFYTNIEGKNDYIQVDIGLSCSSQLPTVRRDYAETGPIPVLRFEEMLGSKISMLTRPRLRGHKRFSDLLDIYNSTGKEGVDCDLLKRMFISAMTRLGIKIKPHELNEMLGWYEKHPDEFERGIENKTAQEINVHVLKEKILTHYAYLFRLTPDEKAYNSKKGNDVLADCRADACRLHVS